MLKHMLQRRGTASEWATANPVLGPGEIGWVEDDHSFKMGDGLTHWNDLPLFSGGSDPAPQITRLDLWKSGTLTVSTGIAPAYINHDGNITLGRLAVGIVPTGASLNVAFRKNESSTLFSLSLPAGQKTIFDDTLALPVVDGDYITINITQVGSTDAGAYLTATLEVTS